MLQPPTRPGYQTTMTRPSDPKPAPRSHSGNATTSTSGNGHAAHIDTASNSRKAAPKGSIDTASSHSGVGSGLSIADIFDLFARKGSQQYDDEAVSHLQHALQTALLAEEAHADCELIVACLLHDLGHLLPAPAENHPDHAHQYRVLPLLRPLFGPGVLDPVKLHVDARRYLCATEAGYYTSLSAGALHSLAQEGGVFNAEQVDHFIRQPHAAQAVALRRWDDKARRADWVTPDLDWFAKYLEQAAKRRQVKLQHDAISSTKTGRKPG